MTKTEYRNKLHPETHLRLQLSHIIPDFKMACSSKQPHWSNWETNIL